MRASDYVRRPVYDSDGTYVGNVSDIRMVQDGPVHGTWGATFRVAGLIVSPNNTGSFLGYERSSVSGPWLVEKVVRWLQRNAKFVAWEDVDGVVDGVVRVRRRLADLPTVRPLR